jgi:formyl-CoA transferase
MADRRANQDRLDELIGQWTVSRTAEEAMESLQQAGVPASIVSQGQDLYHSPHLAAREFYRPSPYYVAQRGTPAWEWERGQSVAWTSPVRMSETPMEFGPYSNIGEDNDYVFQEILGMPEAEVRRLEENGALY